MYHGQIAQTEKIHFQQAYGLAPAHCPLGSDLFIRSHGKRNIIGNIIRRDQDAGCVDGSMPGEAFECF